MEARTEAELSLLRLYYRTVEHRSANGLHWFLVGQIRTPQDWSPDAIDVAFSVTEGHPGAQPYGFFVPEDLTFQGALPTQNSAQHQPPFPGSWRFLSWQPVDWRPTADVRSGSNLWGWVRSFVQRLREGS